MKTMSEFFFMRDGFQTFSLEPAKHNFLLFGKRDRAQRDHLLDHLEEASYSLEGHKSVVIGDYGRGKTHQSRNIEFEIQRRKLNLYPIYIKCAEFKAKDTFNSFFKELILGIPTEYIKKLAQTYEEKSNTGAVAPIDDIIGDEDVTLVFRNGLAAPSINVVRQSMRWLGGEQKLDMSLVSRDLPALHISKQFGAVMKGIVQLFREIDGLVPLYLIDEAERFQQITNPDAYWSWLASFRELTEIVGVALIFFIGSKSRDELPVIFLQDEVITRIGVSNYVEFYNQGRDDLRDFIRELFQTIIRKGEVPEPLNPVLSEKIGKPDNSVPEELRAILTESGDSIDTYPLTGEAFEKLVEICATSALSNKPREVLKLVQKSAGRAIRKNRRIIDNSILEEIMTEGI